ncbi:MAG: polyprenyl synthetase family protein, partial [Clostridia bacterium]|nr:polyprenyl synthetase family protein [Clostridia bacterium]
ACHKQFGEPTALLAGDALEAVAFETAASADLRPKQVLEAVRLLAQATGPYGILDGQILDTENETLSAVDVDRLEATHRKKTGALIRAACVLGCISAGASEEQKSAADDYGAALGMAFQIRDDILDVTGEEQLLGKPVGSDAEEEKPTYVTLLGLEQAARQAEHYTEEAFRALERFEETGFLEDLTRWLLEREN